MPKRIIMRQKGKALMILASMLTESRKQKVASVVSSRTKSIGVLLENVHDKGNENAVVRSMDAFGILTLHKVATVFPSVKKINREARTDAGTRQWVETTDWNSLTECVAELKHKGYKVASTSPNSAVGISDMDFHEKTVIAFGNEKCGVSEDLAKLSDIQFSLPMCGFVESFNISVSVAVTLYHVYTQRVLKMGANGDLTNDEQNQLTLHYYMKSLGISEQQLFYLMHTHSE